MLQVAAIPRREKYFWWYSSASQNVRGGNDLGDDRALVATRLLEPLLRRDRGSLLLRRVEEDHRPVVVADVRTLTVELRRVVVHPEDVEQRVVAHASRVKRDLDGLGVPGAVRAHVLIRGRLREAARVADLGRE